MARRPKLVRHIRLVDGLSTSTVRWEGSSSVEWLENPAERINKFIVLLLFSGVQLVGWLAGRLAGWLADLLAGLLAGSMFVLI